MSLSTEIADLARQLDNLEDDVRDLEKRAQSSVFAEGQDADLFTDLSAAIRRGDRLEAEGLLDRMVGDERRLRDAVELGRFGGRARA